MAERRIFNPKNVAGDKPYTDAVASVTPDSLTVVRNRLSVIMGVTAVHGLEPQQIAANVGLQVNRHFERAGLEPVPIVLPYVPGDPIYGERNTLVLRAVYNAEEKRQIYLSEDLGRALIHTEFGSAGYQQHLTNVRRNVGYVNGALQDLTAEPFEVQSLYGQDKRVIDATQQRILEINAGSNATLAKGSDRADAYEVFPVTFDGLMQYVQAHNEFFEYDAQLLIDVRAIATDLRGHVKGIILPDIHTLGKEPWFEEAFPEAFITPPWKEKLTPPKITIDPEEGKITVENHTGAVDTVSGYHTDKGVVYLNVSGNDMGAQSAKAFIVNAQDEGYVVAAPGWLKEKLITEEKDKELESYMGNMLAAEPNILFANAPDGNRLCKAFFMRLGMGSYAYAQRAGVPIIFLGFETLDNPEMKGNGDVVVDLQIGRRYTGQPNIISEAAAMAPNFERANSRVYEQYDIPREVEGLPAVGTIIMLDQVRSLAA